MDFLQDCSVLTVCCCPEDVSDIPAKINLVNGLYFFFSGSILNMDMYDRSGVNYRGQASHIYIYIFFFSKYAFIKVSISLAIA